MSKDARPQKIILISIDTLRADHLGCYGYGKNTSPNLDSLSKEGVLYPHVFSPCPYTVPTHTSLLTGIYPINNNLNFAQKSGRIDPDSTLFLQEVLREQGYATGAFVSCMVLRRDWGLSHGFDVYDDRMTAPEINRPNELIRDGRETNEAALEWIKKNKDEDLFVWLHYFDVHGPYTSPGPFKPEDYGDSPVLLNKVPDGQPGGIPEYQLLGVRKDEAGEVLDYQRDARHYLAGYDNGIKYEDEVIGHLLEGLKSEGMYDESMVIVTADHGEALGEGGIYFFHGLTVTPEQSRIPLIIKFPAGYEKKTACGSPVSTVDIMPTILDYVGFSYENLRMDGISLTNPDPNRFILSENEWQRAIIWKDYYLLQEKDAVFDGFCYYFDSQGLCRGARLVEYKIGKELSMNLEDPAAELVAYSRLHCRLVDPKERWIKDKDRAIAEKDRAISEKEVVIAEKDNAIEVLGREISIREEAMAKLNSYLSMNLSKIESLMSELESVYNSKSWRITYPIRSIAAKIKGLKELK